MNQYRRLILFVSVLFFVGLLFGLLLPLLLPYDQKAELFHTLQQYLQTYSQEGTWDAKEMFWDKSWLYFIMALLIFLLGLSVIGTPLVLVILFIKGVVIGFASGFVITQLKEKGILFVIFSILPQNLLIVPALIFLSASSLAFSLFLIRNRILKYHGKIKPYFTSYVMVFLGLTSILLVAAIYESYLGPILLERSISFIFR